MKTHIIAGAVALMALGGLGCNGLTGADRFEPDSDDGDSRAEEELVSQAPATKALSCAYPADGQTGVGTGNLVPSSLGYETVLHPFEAAASRLDLSSFYDCDGSKGVDAILVITAKYF